MRFNTALSAMMEFVNGAYKWEGARPRAALAPFVLLLAPYAPHLAEEMWQRLHEGRQQGPSSNGSSTSGSSSGSLAYEPWPVADESLLVESTYNLPVLVGGWVRGAGVGLGRRLSRVNVAEFPCSSPRSSHASITPTAGQRQDAGHGGSGQLGGAGGGGGGGAVAGVGGKALGGQVDQEGHLRARQDPEPHRARQVMGGHSLSGDTAIPLI